MKTYDIFRRYFSKYEILKTYNEKIKNKSSRGIDGITTEAFDRNLKQNIDTIHKKIYNGTYKFVPYKGILILRGCYKLPRIIEKASIRDKLVLRCLYNILLDIFSEELEPRRLHTQIDKIIQDFNNPDFDYIIKKDIKDFFPSINHDILLTKLSTRIQSKRLINLISKTIKNPNNVDQICPSMKKGVPQGLSVSNILSNIYLFDIDKIFSEISNVHYYRFVDDTLIFTKREYAEEIDKRFSKLCNEIKLELHSETKNKVQPKAEEFEFLGYRFYNSTISVRKCSVDKIRHQLIKLLSSFKYSKNKNIDLLLFRLNLRISGCIFNKTKKGWLYYFSQITDQPLLYSLDSFLKKQLVRFELEAQIINVHTFCKTWICIKYDSQNYKYITNFDEYLATGKKKILEIANLHTSDDSLDIDFERFISKEISTLDLDLGHLS